MEVIEKVTVDPLENATRLSDLREVFYTIPSRKGLKKAVDAGRVRRNGELASTGDWINGGEVLELLSAEPVAAQIELSIPVIYEDAHLAIICKPAGIEVSGNKLRVLVNALPAVLMPSNEPDALPRPLPIHRLDYETSGVLVVGKTGAAVRKLNLLFADCEVQKSYLAVTCGQMSKSGSFDSDIDGKKAFTSYELLQTVDSPKFGCLNLLRLDLHTGRRHQLRIHLSRGGHPILGDRNYGGEIVKGRGLYLFAQCVAFEHPVTNQMVKEDASPPKKFRKLFPDQF